MPDGAHSSAAKATKSGWRDEERSQDRQHPITCNASSAPMSEVPMARASSTAAPSPKPATRRPRLPAMLETRTWTALSVSMEPRSASVNLQPIWPCRATRSGWRRKAPSPPTSRWSASAGSPSNVPPKTLASHSTGGQPNCRCRLSTDLQRARLRPRPKSPTASRPSPSGRPSRASAPAGRTGKTRRRCAHAAPSRSWSCRGRPRAATASPSSTSVPAFGALAPSHPRLADPVTGLRWARPPQRR